MRYAQFAPIVLVALLGLALLTPGCASPETDDGAEAPGGGFEATTTPEETTPSVETTPSDEGTGTQLELRVGEQDLERFVRMAEESGVFEVLNALGPYTVFAPTDEALDAMGEERIEELLREENRPELARLVAFHIVPGRWTLDDIRNAGVLPTISGRFITVQVDAEGVVLGDGSTIGSESEESSAGIVYTIDRTLQPSSATDSPNALPPGHPDISPSQEDADPVSWPGR